MSQSDVIQLPGEQSPEMQNHLGEWARLEDAQRWVYDYLAQRKYEVTPGGLFKCGDQLEQHSAVLKKLVVQYDVDYKALNRTLRQYDIKIDPAKKHVMEFALDLKIEEEWKKWLTEKRNILRKTSTSTDLSELRKFIRACTGVDNELDLHVMAHWIWQVKRKMNGLPVRNHIMVVLTGKQGSGKSTAISSLVSPVKEYRLDLNLESLSDERHYHGLSRNFVIVCDEMQGCNKTDIETLKHIVTAESLSARKLYTNAIDTIPQNVSFLGTSNKSLDVLIKDETGMRRFFELRCSDMMDWSAIGSLNPLLIWQEIDEKEPNGYLSSVRDDLKSRQEEYRYQDSAEAYLVETSALSGNLTKTRTVEELFRDYVDWCKDSENRPFDKIYFSKRMRAIGLKERRSANARGYLLGSNFVFWRDRKTASFIDEMDG